ncbi:MAG: OmpP1/FadL family transporter [Gemmatimonadaceae bacterium]
MQLRRGARYWIAVTGLLIANTSAHAQGFGLNEISTCGLGRGFAAVATGCHDASTIYWNPAASTQLNGLKWSFGAAAIGINGKFVQDTSFRTYKGDVSTQVVPHLFLNYHNPASAFAYGIGVYVPYGLTSQWHNDFPGRFSAQKASIQTFYIQPNFGWKLNSKWSIGVGPIIGHSSVELIQAVDLSQQSLTIPGAGSIVLSSLGVPQRTQFATAKLNGDAWGYGAHFGIQGQLSENWTFGIRYLTQIVFKYDDADATFTQNPTGLVVPAAIPNPANPSVIVVPAGTSIDAIVAPFFASGAPLSAQKVSTRIAHPGQLQVGFAYTGVRNWEFEGDYAMIGYKAFKDLPIQFSNTATPSRTLIEDYNNSSAIRLGAEYKFANSARVRGGFSGVTRAAPDVTVTPLLPEQDRANYSLGFSLPILKSLVVDGGYVLVTTPGRRGRIDERSTTVPQTAAQLNSGVYSLTANIFALSLKSSF